MMTIKRVARRTRVEIREVELSNNKHNNKIRKEKVRISNSSKNNSNSSNNQHKLKSNQSNNNNRRTKRKVSEIRTKGIRTMVIL